MDEKLILVVDDEKKIVDAVYSYLVKNGYRAFYAYTGKEALAVFKMHEFDLVILDLMLPDISGEEICRIIRQTSRVPVIMLTAKSGEDDVLHGFDLGADDYVIKPFSPRQLVARVEALLRRASPDISPLNKIMSFNEGDLMIDTAAREVKKKGMTVNLTPNEYKILITLLSVPKRIFSRNDIISNALNGDYDGYDRTVDSHIKNLRHKIETDPKNPEYIKTVYGAGYCFKGAGH